MAVRDCRRRGYAVVRYGRERRERQRQSDGGERERGGDGGEWRRLGEGGEEGGERDVDVASDVAMFLAT